MIQFKTSVNGKPLIFYNDHLSYGGYNIAFNEISDIGHKSEDTPAIVFTYKGKRLALPYQPEEKMQIISIFKNIQTQNSHVPPEHQPSYQSETYQNEQTSTHTENNVEQPSYERHNDYAEQTNVYETPYPATSPSKTELKPFWSVGRLVIGIISMVLSLLVIFQSCAAGIANTLSESGDAGGTAGLITAIMLIAAGIVAVATRKSIKKGGPIANIILYAIGAIMAFANCAVYKDLIIWGVVCLCFAAVFVICLIKQKR